MRRSAVAILAMAGLISGLAGLPGFAAGAAAGAGSGDGFILIKGGSFLMGSPASERQRGSDEMQHRVTVSAFYADPCEVTQKAYEALMGRNPSHFKGAKLPVENVSWYDALEYCNALSRKNGRTPAYTVMGSGDRRTAVWNRAADGYRLLTEAEWEYAERAGTVTIFNVGKQVHSDLVNFEATYPYLIEENYVRTIDPTVVPSYYRGTTIDVDSLRPNAFGLYNTLGNVSEWVWDYYGAYDTQNTVDPAGPLSGSLRVNRGGGYNDFGKHLRSAYRSAANPLDPDQNLGFRICRNAVPGKGTITTVYSLDIRMPENPRILIAFFSYTGNTENAARILQKKLGCDIVEIKMAHPYSGDIYDVSAKDLMADLHPALVTRVKDMDAYDVILLGYPTWWATIPMPVATFLESYNFAGRIILPFSSHGGTMFGDSISAVSKMLPKSYIGQGFEFNYSGGRDLQERLYAWLRQNGINR